MLAATHTQPEKWWYLSELAQFLRTSPSSLQRELKALMDGGILETRREGTRAYFKANTRAPIFPELRGLIDKTASVVPTLRTVLQPLEGRIVCAFIYGSVARSEEHAASDIDLMVVGDVGFAELRPAPESRGAAWPRRQRDQLCRRGVSQEGGSERALPDGGPAGPQTFRDGRSA